MIKLEELPKTQLVHEDRLRTMEAIIADARAGNISNIVMVATTRNIGDTGQVTRVASFTDRLVLLGALETAKDLVNEA